MSSLFLFRTSEAGKFSTVERSFDIAAVGITEGEAIAKERKIEDISYSFLRIKIVKKILVLISNHDK